ncbi:tetratricopeptide repeat protein [bacterium]|nr:tetratricopeptide repeat protein [bacterium]MCI0602568.1 tetratricopeptide repeat protein [bacterium]
MSYTLFLLLNVNHEKEALLGYIAKRLEQTGQESFCFDESPESFFAIEYMQEGSDTSLALDIPYGAEEKVLRDVFDFMTYLESYIQFQVLDPQIGRIMESNESDQIIEKWKNANTEALKQYADGHHFLRTVAERDGKKSMIEAIKFQEETWQNHCSVALAYNRIHDAGNALKHFSRAFELDPENFDILHAIGVTYYNLQNYLEARDVLLKYLQSDPGNEDARQLVRACETKLKS